MSNSPAELGQQPPADSNKKVPLSATWHLASGAVSGAASVLALQPLDLGKEQLQAGLKSKAKIWGTVKEVVRTDGARGLWRGTTPTLYRNVPGVSMYFLTLSRLRSFVGQFPQFRAKGAPLPTDAGSKVKLTTAGDLLVGSTARTGVGFILMPFTLLKTLSESSTSLPRGSSASHSSLSALRQLYTSGGIKSLWRGAVPTALRDAPGAGLFIVFYERGRRLLGIRGDGGGGAVGGGVAGASASLLSTLLTTPFDLIKTRRQISPQTYTSLLSSVAIVYRSGGIRGFWEGGGLRVVRKAGSAGIGWAVYEGVVGLGESRAKLRATATEGRSGGG
ncbi:mitochondrial carrier domain-containing protein [Leucosporidium creatinivorum]|uniref:Mitochondrial carrier domain-containing protein n=1 Tax=Leucosporidium creatinivorum TaxID=106004 RepID=A0A1Y2G337_9BASI|nr:mitochondrial carrier domain-containing protein [Leucosporidium creatinivorum]